MAGLHFYSVARDRENEGRKPDLFQLVPHNFHAGSATL